MKNLIKKYPTLFGTVLLLGIVCAFYLGLWALGLIYDFLPAHLQLSVTLPDGKTNVVEQLIFQPIKGLYLAYMTLMVGFVVAMVCWFIIWACVCIYQAAKMLGAWLSAKQGVSGVAG
ncbi:hypothetical protein [Pseudomonas sp. S1(2024)]|uniref:hypothetical protein n=1 Tax=Pseudomonas sp. S1(2024) TaxID=3390191 RepID=UPI00397A1773